MKLSKKFKVLGMLATLLCLVYMISASILAVKYKGWDSATLYEISKIENSMEVYYETHNSYPPIGNSCASLFELNQYIGDADNEKLLRKISSRTFFEWLLQRPFYPLSASVGKDGQTYVLQVENVYRTGKINGTVIGCNCDSPNYCVGKI